FPGTGTDPDVGDVLTYSWNFGDGSAAVFGANPGDHFFASPGTYTVTLTVTDLAGAMATSTRTIFVTAPSVTGGSLFLPVVLEAHGAGGSFYTSEITVASRAAQAREVLLTYTASTGGGTGFARITLAPGEQRIISGAIAFLRSRSLALPSDGSPAIGTLLAT